MQSIENIMFNKKADCARSGNDSRPKISENHSVMYIKNSSRKDYVVIVVDGCEITEGCKCDNGIYLVDSAESLFVELKGSDIKHAAKQLNETLAHYDFKRKNGVKCFIITSNNPLSKTEAQQLKFRFRQENGVALYIEKSGFEYSYT